MKKINLKKPLQMFSQPVHDENGPVIISQAIARILVQDRSANPIKMTSICLRLHDVGELELDEADFNFLKSSIENCRLASDMLIAAALNELENVD